MVRESPDRLAAALARALPLQGWSGDALLDLAARLAAEGVQLRPERPRAAPWIRRNVHILRDVLAEAGGTVPRGVDPDELAAELDRLGLVAVYERLAGGFQLRRFDVPFSRAEEEDFCRRHASTSAYA